MRYTEPTILNETKATPVIMGVGKFGQNIDAHPTPLTPRTAVSAYEADE